MPESVVRTKVNSYQPTVKRILPIALAREELWRASPLMVQPSTNSYMGSPSDEDRACTYPVGIIVQNHKVSVTNIES